MEVEVKVPRTTKEEKTGVLLSWYKNDGDPVEEGEEIAEVMIEKVTVYVKAPASGRLKILVKENGEVAQGQVIGLIVA
ncbi:dihydrolipoyllysine succinyltransferase [Thermococcus celericrescens]|uniref:Dihydrolipoyllysine succinyltransferase n=1 Tax=Thermococcus celericrescens TaxID=227598 RepID=A0A100XYJ4_9EURY|nr:lipoyl domain-containing protein [Thermococcus celericrescens]KUH33844.1 dihydrolipoyllysine succinyltransferase [Thermococcus celericrescens]